MKQALSILLALALLAVCFTACSESPAETKTDAKPVENANSVVVSQVEGSTDDTVQPTPENLTQQSVQPPILNEETDNPSQDTTSSITDESSSLSEELISGDECLAFEQLRLQSIDELEAFLRGDRPANNQTEADIQSAQSNQGGTYYRPASLNHLDIRGITPYKDSIWYFCDLNPKQTKPIDYDIGLYWGDLGAEDNTFEFIKNHEDGKTAIVNGIEYAYKVGIDGYYGVSWKQFGCTCIAAFYFTVDHIEDYLPLLRFEQASYQSNSDHVTQ